MFKGIGKQVVVIKKPESKIFEEVIFFIKDDISNASTDIISECNKIISHGNDIKGIQKRKYKKIYPLIIVILVVIIFIESLIMLTV